MRPPFQSIALHIKNGAYVAPKNQPASLSRLCGQHVVRQFAYKPYHNPKLNRPVKVGSSTPNPFPIILANFARLEDAARIAGYSTLKIGSAVALLGGLSYYMLGEAVNEHLHKSNSAVAIFLMHDKHKAQIKAENLSASMLSNILTDEKLEKRTVTFICKMCERQDVQKSLMKFMANVLNDEDSQHKFSELASKTMTKILEDEKFKQELQESFKSLLEHEEVRSALLSLMRFTLENDDIKGSAREFFGDIIEPRQHPSQPIVQVPERGGSLLGGIFSYMVPTRLFSSGYNKPATAVPIVYETQNHPGKAPK